jgi:inhibitor of cysteine peptidase
MRPMAKAVGRTARSRIVDGSRPGVDLALLVGVVAIVALAAALLVVGDGPTGSAPPSEIQVADRDDGTTVRLARGGVLIVALASNPSTGYAWAVSDRSAPALTLAAPAQYVPPGSTAPVVGAPGTEVFRFIGAAAGRHELLLEYVRSFEPNAPPIRTFRLTIQID